MACVIGHEVGRFVGNGISYNTDTGIEEKFRTINFTFIFYFNTGERIIKRTSCKESEADTHEANFVSSVYAQYSNCPAPLPQDDILPITEGEIYSQNGSYQGIQQEFNNLGQMLNNIDYDSTTQTVTQQVQEVKTQTDQVSSNNEQIVQNYFTYAGVSPLSPVQNRSTTEIIKDTDTSYTRTVINPVSASSGGKTYSIGTLTDASSNTGTISFQYRYYVDHYYNGDFKYSSSGQKTTWDLAQQAMKGAMTHFSSLYGGSTDLPSLTMPSITGGTSTGGGDTTTTPEETPEEDNRTPTTCCLLANCYPDLYVLI